MALAGRTIQEVSDTSLQEQLYLYERTRRLKAALEGQTLSAASKEAPPLCDIADADVPEKVGNRNCTVYLMFMESSTRTRESFRNAAAFHGVKVNEFQAESSSFQKNETMTDAVKMLTVYSTNRSVFVIRSPVEGVCTWLATALPSHADKFGLPAPAFVNAGDGRNTHPIVEFLDTFSLLENSNWNRSRIHLALVGDLAQGRTARSKVEGLKVFENVRVDLIAPESFQYPVEFRERMRRNGFEIRQFDSVEEYLNTAGDSLAPTWYFYRPQFKRYGDISKSTADDLRSKVTFRQEWQQQLPSGTCFFQTLPRDKELPLIPLQFDATSLNGWDRVANNSYYLHIVLLSSLFGQIGKNLSGTSVPVMARSSSQPKLGLICSPFDKAASNMEIPVFMKKVDLTNRDNIRRPERATAGSAVPIKDGIVLDHIGLCSDPAEVWRRLRLVRTILGWSQCIGSEGVFPSKTKSSLKGVICLPLFDANSIMVPQMKVLASIAPGCTVNAIAGSHVVCKYRLSTPERIYDLPCIRCKNLFCVANPANKQRDVTAFFTRVPFFESSVYQGRKDGDYLFECRYCKCPHDYSDIMAEAETRVAGGSFGD
eukprot:TRINITY_DN12138_c0_g1_i1.p1 TRINITY_DN12138_c0_g1~~TRINITY_DN12138_c0_g1_i1.p1  ORF type:complete len:620 (+),score=86.21 TRINITY_DN12138_c0_g1_i1:71-1861(+)